MALKDTMQTRILEAAEKRFKHYGYAKTSMAEIAADLGMSPGNLYRYFPSKIDMALAIADEHHEAQFQELAAIAATDQPALERLLDLPIVGDVRGDGYFFGIELVKDKVTKETFDDDESERLLRGFLSKALLDAGLYCRADDRGDPVIQLAPPLIVGQPEFDEIEQILRHVLTEGMALL